MSKTIQQQKRTREAKLVSRDPEPCARLDRDTKHVLKGTRKVKPLLRGSREAKYVSIQDSLDEKHASTGYGE